MTHINEKALEVATRLMGSEEDARNYFETLAGMDEEFGRLTQEFGWAGMYARTILDDRTRELVAVGALAVLAKYPQMKDHAKMALRFGASREEVLEVLLQMVVFAGFPTALGGIKALEAAFEEFAREKGG